jgi:hypothetical protein
MTASGVATSARLPTVAVRLSGTKCDTNTQ